MNNLDERHVIWKQTPGASELYEIYGYFPTLHDALVTKVDVRFESKEIILTIEYGDLIEKSAETIAREDYSTTRFQLRWRGVQQAKFNLHAEDIYHMKLRQVDELIEARFTDYSFGFDGFILADSIEVLGVEEIAEIQRANGLPFSFEN